MADTKITSLGEDTTPADGDFIVTVDVSDTTMSVNGTDKKVQLSNAVTKTRVGLSSVTNDAQLKIASNLSDLNNASTARTNLGLAIGTDVQAHDTDLDTIAGLTATTDNFMVAASSAWASRTPTQARTSLGLGAVALLSSVDLTSNVTGTLPVANGGTGRATSTTAYGLLAAGTTATGAHQTLATGSSGNILKSNGAGALPTFQAGAASDVGLGNVTNNAQYYPSGTDVAVADGGTGSSTAAGARTNLGLVIGTDVEAHDTDLTTIGGLSPSNDDVIQRKAGAWANRTMAQLAADLKVSIGSSLFPIGSYYMNETDSTNPGTLLGFGTWTAVTDKMIMAVGSTYLASTTGGSDSHTHILSSNGQAKIASTGSGLFMFRVGTGFTPSRIATVSGDASNTTPQSVSAGLQGTTDAQTTLPPYQTAYVWKRTA